MCTVLEKSKETVLEFYKGTVNVLQKHTKQNKTVDVKLSDSQLTGTTLRMNAKMFSANNLPHELLLTARQTKQLN